MVGWPQIGAIKSYGMQWRLQRLTRTRKSANSDGATKARSGMCTMAQPASNEQVDLNDKVGHNYEIGQNESLGSSLRPLAKPTTARKLWMVFERFWE